LEPEERELVRALVINKFRGDASLLTDGLTWLEKRTGIPVAGVVHHFRDIRIPEEDSVALELPATTRKEAALDIAVIRLPHISNFDDFDPLAGHAGVSLRYVDCVGDLGRPDLVIIPGTKTTIPDLAWMNERGLTCAVKARHRDGSAVIGICGGYQMLGQLVSDPERAESSLSQMDGLGLLATTTVFHGIKETHRVKGTVIGATGLLSGAAGLPVTGYEIHMGRTSGEGVASPVRIDDRADALLADNDCFDGAMDDAGNVMGTYIHGLFHNGALRGAILNELAHRKGVSLPKGADLDMDREFDRLADWVRSSLDMNLVYSLAGLDRDHYGRLAARG
jgi:adenosylcobyric acid synthase